MLGDMSSNRGVVTAMFAQPTSRRGVLAKPKGEKSESDDSKADGNAVSINSVNAREKNVGALQLEAKSEHKSLTKGRFGRSASAAVSTSMHRKTKCVSISDDVQTVEIPTDQDTSLRVWTVYSPVFYVSRDEQQKIRRQCEMRAQKLRKLCSSLLDVSHKGDPARSLGHNYSTYLRGIFHVGPRVSRTARSSAGGGKEAGEAGYSSHLSATLCFILSTHADAPISVYPVLTVPVERAFSDLFTPVRLCIFREVPAAPVCCFTALRMLRNPESEEGSIAVYGGHHRSELEAYIPLSAIDAVSRGLQREERNIYVDKDGAFRCTSMADQRIINIRPELIFTLHCFVGQGFYISFAAVEEHVFATWIAVLTYIVDTNTKCRAYGKQ